MVRFNFFFHKSLNVYTKTKYFLNEKCYEIMLDRDRLRIMVSNATFNNISR